MSASAETTRARIHPLVVIGLWGAYAVISINQSVLWQQLTNTERPWYVAVNFALAIAIIWCCFTPLVIHLARRFPLGGARWQKSLLVHAPAALILCALDVLIDRTLAPHIGLSKAETFIGGFLYQLDMNAFYYVVIAASVTTADMLAVARERQRKAAELHTELVTSRLEVLKMQLQPHFLFNTLHSINTLIHEDPQAADHMVTRLADLLRLTLYDASHEVPLARELELVRAYIEIQRIRFGPRLDVDIDIEPELYDAQVPALLLQPLVENAIRHGLAPRTTGGSIEIAARRDGETLHIRISDDGIGLKPHKNGRCGIGLANTRARLQQLYGDDQSLTLTPRESGGVVVAIRLPYAEVPASQDLVAVGA